VGLDARWRDEQGSDLGAVTDPQMVFSRHIQSSLWSETRCLQFIDPYGDTVFNQRQIPVLVRELESSEIAVTDAAIKQQICDVVRLLKSAEGHTHTYAWFIGD
jgi:hypothetical protein